MTSSSVLTFKKKVVELTLAGHTDAKIAEILKVTPGYISQIKSDVTWQSLYQELVAAQGVSSFQEAQAIDKNWNALEKMFTDALVENASEVIAALASKPATLISFGKLLNGAKRRASGEAAPTNGSKEVGAVPLELPAFMVAAAQAALPAVVHNERQEIVEVDGRTLVAMGSGSLRALAEKAGGAGLPSVGSEGSDSSEGTYIKEGRLSAAPGAPSLTGLTGSFEFSIDQMPAPSQAISG